MSISDVDGIIGALCSIIALLIGWLYRNYKVHQKEKIERALQSAERDKKIDKLVSDIAQFTNDINQLRTDMMSQMETMYRNFRKNDDHHANFENKFKIIEEWNDDLSNEIKELKKDTKDLKTEMLQNFKSITEVIYELKNGQVVIKDLHNMVSNIHTELKAHNDKLITNAIKLDMIEKNCEKYHDN